MSRRSHFDISPMIDKVQKDITNLCYLGLHQYAKENKLIGRSRPLLNDGMTPYYIRRLFFRLTVACVKQMIDTINWSHGERLEQVNYINVGGYTTLRLYGLLDREMFIVPRDKGYPLWQGLIPSEDWVHLSQERPLGEITEFLSLPTRAVLEVGGERFTNTLRSAMQYIRDEEEVKLHIQYEPKDRFKVKNIAIDLELYELPYIGRGRGWERVTAIPNRHPGRVEVPCHIEKIIHFRNNIYPFVNDLSADEVRESFLYLVQNWPSGDAIQIKHRELQMSQEEVERIQRQQEEQEEARENEMEAIRERFRVAFGDQRGEQRTPEELAEALLNRAAEGPGTETDLEHGDPVAHDAVQQANIHLEDAMAEDEVPCNICEGDWNQCDCCGDCESTGEDCTCWQCGDCGEHTDECTCDQCGTCGHEECRCCGECHELPCQCLEQEAVLTDEEESNIELLRRKVHDALGD